MNKLIASIASISACFSAGAVSVFSYFPSGEVKASGPDFSSLVVTDINADDTYPVFTFTQDEVVNNPSSAIANVYFCPTGWTTDNPSHVSPSEYGSYSSSSGDIVLSVFWDTSSSRFVVRISTEFPALNGGKKLFSSLYMFDLNAKAGLTDQPINVSVSCETAGYFSVTNYYYAGSILSPESGKPDYGIQFAGTIGNDYSLWRYSLGYNSGYNTGYNTGNSDGYDDGHEVGYNDGYNEGHDDGYNDGYNEGHGDGYNEGHDDGVNEVSSNFGVWDLFSNAFGSIGNILNIQLFPGVTLGLMLSVPIVFAFLLWLIHVLRG
jgi:hypothetical protein